MWKVADFGLMVEGALTEITTENGMGTPCYRAPELLNPDGKCKYSNKVDIWAIGCILYEVVLGKKAFANDWIMLQYSLDNRTYQRRLEISFDTVDIPISYGDKAFLSERIQQMLKVEASQRPTARDLLANFSNRLVTDHSQPTSNSFESAAYKKESKFRMSVTDPRVRNAKDSDDTGFIIVNLEDPQSDEATTLVYRASSKLIIGIDG